MTTKFTGTNIANVIAKEINAVNTAGLDSCLLVTQGGTNQSAGVFLDLTEDDLDLLLADGNAISAITPIHTKPDALVGLFKTVSAMASITKTTDNTTWSGGIVSLDTTTNHGLPTGESFYVRFAGYVTDGADSTVLNGDRLVTITDANSLTFDLADDFGTVTTEGTLSVIHATITGHGLPQNIPIYSHFTGVSVAAINGERLTVYTDANNAYFAFDVVAGTITTASAKVKVAKLTLINNGLVDNIPLPIYVIGVNVAAYNGSKMATVVGDDIYYAVNAINVAPNKNIAKISYVIIDVSGALAESVGTENVYSLSGNAPVTFNGNFDAVVTDTNTFVFAPTANLGTVTSLGKVLDYDAAILNKMKTSFFAQNTGLRISVLDTGAGTVSEAITALDNYLFDNPMRHHAVVLPPAFDVSSMATLTATHSDSLNDFGLFFIPLSNYANQTLFINQKQVALSYDSNVAGSGEYLAAAEAALFCYQTASPANKLPTFTYAKLNGISAYQFTSEQDSLRKELISRGISFTVDQSEGGSSDTMIYNGVCQGKDDFGNYIDLSSIWAKNYMIVTLDKAFAKFLMDNRTNPDMRFSLNDSGGQAAVRQTVAVAQKEIDTFANSGVCEPATVQFVEYHQWKVANPALQAAKNLSNNLSVSTSVARGLFKITFNLGVSF